MDTNKYTPHVMQALRLANQEAARLKHGYVGTEHMLLGIVALGQGVAVKVLERSGINFAALRLEVEKAVEQGSKPQGGGTFPLTPRLKKALGLAESSARELNHEYVGTEHVLVGLLCEGEGVAARVLRNSNVDLEKTRIEIMKELDPNHKGPETVVGQKKEGGGMMKPGVSIVGQVPLYAVSIEGRGGDSVRDQYYRNSEDAIVASALDGQNLTPRSVTVLELSDGTFIEMPTVISISEPPSTEDMAQLLQSLTAGQLIAAKRRMKSMS